MMPMELITSFKNNIKILKHNLPLTIIASGYLVRSYALRGGGSSAQPLKKHVRA